ncbi:MAG: chromosome partitioning protein ParB, partial [Bacteroidetes bacterium]
MGEIIGSGQEEIAEEEFLGFTDWVNEPKVEDLKQDFEDARSDHSEQTGKIDYWLNSLNITGHARPKKNPGRSEIQPKLIRKQAEWRYAALSEPFLSTDDVFNTEPVTFEDRQAAIQNGLVLNNQFNTKIQKVKFFDEYVRTCVDEGTVIVRVGWDFTEGEVEVPNFVPQTIQDPQAAQAIITAIQAIQQDPAAAEQIPEAMKEDIQLSMEYGTPTELVQDGLKVEMETLKNQPSVEVCNYNNVIIDPTCLGDLEKANFIIYSFETNLAELERDGKYQNLDDINIENNTILGEPDHVGSDDSSFNFTDKPRKKFVAYEYWGFWDINGEGLVEPIVATWVGS